MYLTDKLYGKKLSCSLQKQHNTRRHYPTKKTNHTSLMRTHKKADRMLSRTEISDPDLKNKVKSNFYMGLSKNPQRVVRKELLTLC